MSLVSITRSLLAEKLFEPKLDQPPLPINSSGQIIRAVALAAFVAFCLGQLIKQKAVQAGSTRPSGNIGEMGIKTAR
jgi:hypothetical protein